jgi:murein DD-endopeptidase MepM/ murein hydrolase activator NlpD
LNTVLIKSSLLFFCFLFLSTATQAFPKHDPVPGGIALIKLSAKSANEQPVAYYKKNKIAILTNNNNSYAMAGLSLSTKPGKKNIYLIWPDGHKEKKSFTVKAKTYEAQYLTIKNKRKVNPYKKDMDRIIKEKTKKNKARTHWSNDKTNLDLIIPVHGRISSIFGLRRFFNEQARRPHSGLDIAAPEGTPIKAVESGTVIEAGDFFFSGNMVYIDHGQGVISLYAHMNSIEVKTGDKISKGQIIGTVGETGRVTGPHLHLAIIANQTLVDPVLLLPDLSELKKLAKTHK